MLLSPYAEKIEAVFTERDGVEATGEALSGLPVADWVVSYGYRHLIKEPVLTAFAGRMINIHISLLPWNKGADPNFWSWFDHTPKGVTIHLIDAGIDTGPILVQEEVLFDFPEKETLASSYERLHAEARGLLSRSWPLIRTEQLIASPQQGEGTFHRLKDKERYFKQLPLGYDTPVSIVEKMGREL